MFLISKRGGSIVRQNFAKALDLVLKYEGGRSNNPADPGGLTIYGISAKSYLNEVKQMDALWQQGKYEDAKKIAAKIYEKNYWNACNCDSLPSPLDIIVFDTAVNMGVYTAKLLLKEAEDWHDYLFLRAIRYIDITTKNQKLFVFLAGWRNRIANLRKQFLNR